MPSWLAAYRLLCKCTPGLPEVAIRMHDLSELERSYSHVLLYRPQPKAMVTLEGRSVNCSTKMYGFYLRLSPGPDQGGQEGRRDPGEFSGMASDA